MDSTRYIFRLHSAQGLIYLTIQIWYSLFEKPIYKHSMNGSCSYHFVIYYSVKAVIKSDNYYPFFFKYISKFYL